MTSACDVAFLAQFTAISDQLIIGCDASCLPIRNTHGSLQLKLDEESSFVSEKS